jgi:hypothetical protein
MTRKLSVAEIINDTELLEEGMLEFQLETLLTAWLGTVSRWQSSGLKEILYLFYRSVIIFFYRFLNCYYLFKREKLVSTR